MSCSTHTPPPVDGINELDEMLRDDRNAPEPTQTDIEEWAPTSQPAKQQTQHQAARKPEIESNDRRSKASTRNNKTGRNKKTQPSSKQKTEKKVVSRSSVKERQQPSHGNSLAATTRVELKDESLAEVIHRFASLARPPSKADPAR